MDLFKKQGENDRQFIFRLGRAKEQGIIDLDWKQLTEIFNKELTELKGPDDNLSVSTLQQQYRIAVLYYEDVFKDMNLSEEHIEQLNEIDIKTQEMYKQQVKMQDVAREYHKRLREDARDEAITERIVQAINNLKPIVTPTYLPEVSENNSYLLAWGDAHYGIEYEIKDLYGGILNAYSPEIFKERMWDLYNQLVVLIEKEQITELNAWELGDALQGILRLNSQLMKLRYGIIESSILYAEFLANWLNELSKIVRIKYQMVVDSNHNQLRICNAPKNAFPEENMSKVIITFLKERLKNNPNISFIENPTGLNFDNLSGFNCLGIHGEVKNLSTALNDFSRTYKTHIDYIIGAHLHHKTTEETGRRSEALSIPSIIGVDPYSMSINKTSDAGASLFVFNEDKGLICEHRLKVN
jgi:hypothetical protein